MGLQVRFQGLTTPGSSVAWMVMFLMRCVSRSLLSLLASSSVTAFTCKCQALTLPRDLDSQLTDQRSGLAAGPAVSQPLWNSMPAFFRGTDFLRDPAELDPMSPLPAFVNPLPARIGSEEVSYLTCKGALSLPEPGLQRHLLQAYIEFVHPYMPLLELHDFLGRINTRDGKNGQVSLLLYHAVMFAASAFVKMQALNEAGFENRRAARKAFFQKARVGTCSGVALYTYIGIPVLIAAAPL